MQFTFNEGHIQLPSQWQDQSMQVLVSTDNSGINLVITREAVPQGTLTPELYQETLALYQGKLDGYTEHACREITLAEAPAWLLDYSWRHCCKVSDEAAFCLIQRPYISKTLLTRRISPRGSP